MPTLAVDAAGRLGIAYHESDGADRMVHYVFRGSTNPLATIPVWQGAAVAAGQPPQQLSGIPMELSPFRAVPPVISTGDVDTHGPRVFGDYETMITTAPLAECTAEGNFWAGFAQIDEKNTETQTTNPQVSGACDVVTREIALSAP